MILLSTSGNVLSEKQTLLSSRFFKFVFAVSKRVYYRVDSQGSDSELLKNINIHSYMLISRAIL
jgi:alpha-mannosidase